MEEKSAFEQEWQTSRVILEYIGTEVVNHYFLNGSQPFKLKGSVVAAYTTIFSLCTSKPSYKEMVFEKYKQTLRQFLLRNTRKQKSIKQFILIWEMYIMYMTSIQKRVFSYLDRYYTPALEEGSLHNVGLKVFLAFVLPKISKEFYFNEYIQQLGKMRDKKIICNNQLLKFTQILMTIYQASINEYAFLPQLIVILINQTQSFYNYFYNLNSNKTPLQYLHSINNLSYFQQAILLKILPKSCPIMPPLSQAFDKILVKNYTDILLSHSQGLTYFLQRKDIQSLKLVSKIYHQFQGFDKLRVHIYNFVIGKGQYLTLKTQKLKNSKVLIEQFFAFIKDTRKLLMDGFQNNKDIEISFKNSIEFLVAKRENLVDDLFIYTRSILDEGNLENYKQIVKGFFEILPSKDQFLHHYQDSLHQRILNQSFVYSVQRNFINEVNNICGSELLTRIDKKIQDYTQNLHINSEYSKIRFQKDYFALNTKIINFQLWEKKFQEQITLNITLVEPLLTLWSRFQNFYKEKQEKRKLTLLPFQTKIILKIKFNQTVIQIKCNLLQACIIHYLADKNYCSEDDIIVNLTIQKTVLYRFLESMPGFIQCVDSGVYGFDWNYVPKDSFVDIDEKAKQGRSIPKTILQDRDILINAAIIKSMKRMKQLRFEQIVEEVGKKIKLFKPQPSNIKICLQKLIKNEELEQVDGIIRYLE